MADGRLKDSWKRKSVVRSYSQQCKRQDGRLGPTGSLGGGSGCVSGLPSLATIFCILIRSLEKEERTSDYNVT